MRRIKYLILFLICFVGVSSNVYADSVSLSASKTTITVGTSVNVTANVITDSPLVSIEGSFKCTGAGTSNGVDMAWDDSSNSVKSKSFSVSVKPTETGKITCTTSGVRLTKMSSDSWINIGNKSVTITVNAASSGSSSNSSSSSSSGVKKYSSDNDLKNLEVEGYKISPEFNKDTTEYTLTVDDDVETVKINATSNDSKATVTGTGDIKLSSGDNNIEVKVTAENGNDKIYKIKIVVEDQNPITVKIGESEYTVIKKNNDVLKVLDDFEESSLILDDEEVVSYVNEKCKITLVILKDSLGNSNYYIYDSTKNLYTLFKYYTLDNVNLYLESMPNNLVPKYYEKTSFKLDDEKIEAYKLKDGNNYLVYGTDLSTGEKSIYLYDLVNNDIIKYDDSEVSLYNGKIKIYRNCVIASIGVLLFVIIVIMIKVILKARKRKKKIKRV